MFVKQKNNRNKVSNSSSTTSEPSTNVTQGIENSSFRVTTNEDPHAKPPKYDDLSIHDGLPSYSYCLNSLQK